MGLKKLILVFCTGFGMGALINSFLNDLGIGKIPVSGEAFFIAVIVLGAWFWYSINPNKATKSTKGRKDNEN